MGDAQGTRYSAGAGKRPNEGAGHAQRRFVAAVLGLAVLGLAVLCAGLLPPRTRPRRLTVHGRSMEPYLADGDRLLVLRPLRVRTGDVVAATDPREANRIVVKRVEHILPEGVYLLGDNPAQSTDSRQFGPVPHSRVLGRAVYRYYPRQRAGYLRRGATTAPGTSRASRPSPQR